MIKVHTAHLKYGNGSISVDIPDQNLMQILQAGFSENQIDETAETTAIMEALQNPVGTARLSEIVQKGQRIAVMVSDITRPVPSNKLLPALLHELSLGGVQDGDIRIIFGMGIHRRHSEQEKRKLVGDDIFERIRCVDSNEESYLSLGRTKRGTPVNLCRSVVEADVRICTGNIEYHYFAGYSGGAKAIMPGAADYECIRHNHQLQLDEKAASGVLDGNPVREDIDEINELLNITFILNVVLNDKKQVLQAFAGHYLEAHRAGCRYLDTLYSIQLPEPADIVLVSAGGAPKDINMYQAHKALDNASQAVKPGGVIILAAECSENYGETTFESWIRESDTPDQLINRLKREFVLGGHKAAAIAKIVSKASVLLVSAMLPEDAARLYFTPLPDVQQALNEAFKRMGDDARVLVIPQGGSILPYVNTGS
jgi:lactate racemase